MIPDKSLFTRREWRLIQQLRTPELVQSYLSSIPYNREMMTCLSFRGVVQQNRAYCLEGAVFAATVLEQHGYPPLVVSIESKDKLDHVLYLFRERGLYGAIARSRDIALHGRKPVYRRVRDLVMSYFDPYIDKTARITGYAVADLNDLGGNDWRLSTRNVWRVERFLQNIPHTEIKSSDARYEKWKRRYLEFRRGNPNRSPDYFPTRDIWLL